MGALFLKLCFSGRSMFLYVMSILAAIIVFYQFWAFPSGTGGGYFSASFPGENDSSLFAIRNTPRSGNLSMNKMGEEDEDDSLESVSKTSENDVFFYNGLSLRHVENRVKKQYILGNRTASSLHMEDTENVDFSTNFSTIFGPVDNIGTLGTRTSTPASTQVLESDFASKISDEELSLKKDSLIIERYVRKMRGPIVTFSQMKSKLLNGPSSSTSVRRRWSTARDCELLSASLEIKNAPILRNFSDLYAPLFLNVSLFKRSYDLMERLLKIYIYKEGEKPIFHQPRLRGVYAAEGWFMKLIERSKRFIVRDPRKAHLYYLPFSSEILRMTLYEKKSSSMKNLEHYLEGYVDLIKKKYRFWNRTHGEDHFFVACHDWAPRITRRHMSSCIRALCNTNLARGFTIGKDVSVPVTYIRSGNDPSRDIGGKPPSERHILAFFAGGMHGYLRPLLLKYWENKVPDMKILGPMQRNPEGKAVYRDFMKSSKYCISARGYEVHTPRVVESILYECVPVIISDNYVPPFFEVLDWEKFAVFVQEKDIPNLRNILLSIPDDRYLDMQLRVKMVQKHFIWHKVPEKYDLFHMILHSIWYNRVSWVTK